MCYISYIQGVPCGLTEMMFIKKGGRTRRGVRMKRVTE